MADNSKIEWTDATWNPVRAARKSMGSTKVGTHCEHVSEGCRNCYAETFNRRGLPNAGTGLYYKPGHRDHLTHFLDEKMLLAPLRRRKPTRYFLSSLTDVFGAWVTDDMLDRMFAVMALCPQHTFQVLTKRPERMRAYLEKLSRVWILRLSHTMSANDAMTRAADKPGRETPRWPLPNAWLGTSVEDQRAADERIPHLLATPAAVRFLSCEPLLGAVDLTNLNVPVISDAWEPDAGCDALSGYNPQTFGFDDMARVAKIDWVIAGGESGPGARPMHPDWARALRDQCAGAGVPFFFKQWGEWVPVPPHDRRLNVECREFDGADFVDLRAASERQVAHDNAMFRFGKAAAGRLLDGIEHNGMPG
jgi:protein gp37